MESFDCKREEVVTPRIVVAAADELVVLVDVCLRRTAEGAEVSLMQPKSIRRT